MIKAFRKSSISSAWNNSADPLPYKLERLQSSGFGFFISNKSSDGICVTQLTGPLETIKLEQKPAGFFVHPVAARKNAESEAFSWLSNLHKTAGSWSLTATAVGNEMNKKITSGFRHNMGAWISWLNMDAYDQEGAVA